jgi:hypothetical protein
VPIFVVGFVRVVPSFYYVIRHSTPVQTNIFLWDQTRRITLKLQLQPLYILAETYTVVTGVENSSVSRSRPRPFLKKMPNFGMSVWRNSMGPTGPFSFGFSIPASVYFVEADCLCRIQWLYMVMKRESNSFSTNLLRQRHVFFLFLVTKWAQYAHSRLTCSL